MSNTTTAIVLLESDIDLGRLEEEEEALRRVSPIEGALGRNASDYHNMFTLFRQIVERANALNENPNAFMGPMGQINTKALDSWTKLINTARQTLQNLNSMRNADRMTSYILDRHTRDLVQAVTVELGLELKEILDMVENEGGTADDVAFKIRKLMHRRLPDIFLRSATGTLQTVKQEYGLIN